MPRLPLPGQDSGTWGDILNEFLEVSHNADGTLKDSSAVKLSGNQTIAGTKTFSSSPIVPTPTNNTDVASKGYVDGVAAGGVSDGDKGDITVSGSGATWSIDNGVITGTKIANDTITDVNINSSAAIAQSKIANLTTDLSNKQASDADLTTIAGLSPTNDDIIQRKAGAWTNRTPAQLKTDLSLTKTDVGLANVDNTSDANKPVSTAQQTAIDAKVADAINDGTTTVAPSQNAVFDALAGKADASNVVLKSDYDANTILVANSDNIPVTLAVGPSTIVARLSSGDVLAATPAQTKTLLAITTTDITDFNDEVPEIVNGDRIDTTLDGILDTLTIDVDLAGGKAGGDTLAGGTGSAEKLTLASTTHATQGTVELLATNPTYTSSPAQLFGTDSTRVITANYASQIQPSFISAQDTRVMSTLGSSGTFPIRGFDWAITYKNANGVIAHLANSAFGNTGAAFNDRSVIQSDGAAIDIGFYTSFRATTTYNVINSGSFSSGAHRSFQSVVTVSAGALLNNVYHFVITDVANTGTVTAQYGLDIPILANATTNVGIRNASTTVLVPAVNTNITATTATIRNDASIVTLTANASYTLSGVATIADGQNGQVLKIINVDATDTITLTDGTTQNLQLSAGTVALGPMDSIELTFLTAIGDWVQTGQVNVA